MSDVRDIYRKTLLGLVFNPGGAPFLFGFNDFAGKASVAVFEIEDFKNNRPTGLFEQSDQ